MQTLHHWEKQVKEEKFPRWEASKIIKEKTFERFNEERAKGTIMHDTDIRMIMLDEARNINFENFKVNISLLFICTLIFFEIC